MKTFFRFLGSGKSNRCHSSSSRCRRNPGICRRIGSWVRDPHPEFIAAFSEKNSGSEIFRFFPPHRTNCAPSGKKHKNCETPQNDNYVPFFSRLQQKRQKLNRLEIDIETNFCLRSPQPEFDFSIKTATSETTANFFFNFLANREEKNLKVFGHVRRCCWRLVCPWT